MLKFIERQGLEKGEQLFELKKFNRHAAIYRITRSLNLDPKRIRNRIKEITKPNIFRGLAFGVCIESETLPENLDDLFEAIDIRQKERAVWQWTIIQVNNPIIAIGFHTWMNVTLTSVYEKNLDELENAGYPTEKFKRQKGKVMKILTSLQPKYVFKDYQDTDRGESHNSD